ncbi:hypothetical protein HHK36_015906 [Tetracentron sinense]|uniref:GIR1-like zinc ribbon domain-containing protein n=1 Tax=Tetracentron sinense TaxID=13715 RepID=A0A834Z624_TETSI|nr:hypothetical protein HHK36_015906 [Tetracentron sinense]
MTGPLNMAAITASLERSLQNCSLNYGGREDGGDVGRSETSDVPENLTNDDTSLELNSHVALPYQWEQCLDLKTGEIYYINWRNGMKAKEDPRKTARFGGDFYSEEDISYDSEGSTSDSYISSSRDDYRDEGDHVLVVAGCKRCLMYFMLPKQVEECPKCSGLLLHFDRSENGFP